MVQQGWAVSYGDYRNEEVVARREKRGIWAGSFEVPYQWRKEHQKPNVEPETGHETSASDVISDMISYIRGYVSTLLNSLVWSPIGIMENMDELRHSIQACRICRDAPQFLPPLPHEPNPVCIISDTARIAICGQAPGIRVHNSSLPFNDPSGDRLRQWLGTTREEFYDPARFAIVPMGFAFLVMTSMAAISHRVANAVRPGMIVSLLLCRSSSSFWSSDNMRLPIICLNGAKRASQKRSRTGAVLWKHRMLRDEQFYLCRIHPGVTAVGSNEIPGLIRKSFPFFAKKSATCWWIENKF